MAKAVGVAGGWAFRDVEVVATEGAPEVRLSGRIAELAPGPVRISLTHTRTTAGAVAIVAA